MTAVVVFLLVWAATIVLLLVIAWTRWYWRLRRRRIARLAKRSIDKAERRLRTPARVR